MIAFFSQSVALLYIFQFFSAVLCYFYGFCLFAMAFAEDIKREFIALTEANASPDEFKQKMVEIIDFHTQAKELN